MLSSSNVFFGGEGTFWGFAPPEDSQV